MAGAGARMSRATRHPDRTQDGPRTPHVERRASQCVTRGATRHSPFSGSTRMHSLPGELVCGHGNYYLYNVVRVHRTTVFSLFTNEETDPVGTTVVQSDSCTAAVLYYNVRPRLK